MSAMTALTGFGLTGQKLRDATEAAVAFSAKTGDLETAANMLGRAYLGSTNRLILYGIKVDESIPKEQRFAEVMRQAMKNQEGARKETERSSRFQSLQPRWARKPYRNLPPD